MKRFLLLSLISVLILSLVLSSVYAYRTYNISNSKVVCDYEGDYAFGSEEVIKINRDFLGNIKSIESPKGWVCEVEK